MRGILVVALVAAAALAPPAASAAHKRKPRVDLSILPLPPAALGAAGASLQPQWQDSGPVPNYDAASNANGQVTPGQLKKLGRVLGYAVDYGDPFTGATGVTEIKTSVEQYKTAADATRGLAFWRKDGAKVALLTKALVHVTVGKLKPRRVGQADFAYLITERAGSQSPIYYVDEQAKEGRYVIDVDVAAGNPSAARQLAPGLARKLDARVRRAVAGHLNGTPVEIPYPQDSGPPPGGPDLSKLILQPADVGQAQIQNLNQGYSEAPYAISDYGMFLSPAGPYDALDQSLAWYPTATEATVIAPYSPLVSGNFQVASTGPLTLTSTPVDVSSAGDHATAQIVGFGDPSGGFGFAFVTLTRGQLVDTVTLLANTALEPAGLLSVAKAMAMRLDAGYSG
jgi:hypothetical protein